MKNIYSTLLKSKIEHKKELAILLDPDKIDLDNVELLIKKINQSPATYIFIGGSHVENNITQDLIDILKPKCQIPLLLFPGNPSQISDKADGILFLSLLSGRNPDYLIDYQVQAAPILNKTNLEIIPTAYLLIESGGETAVSRISNTKPMDRENLQLVLATALAGEMLGHKLLYLEAGSGAKLAVPQEMIQLISNNLKIPIIVGGGIQTQKGIQDAYDSGADMVVIGTAFENDFNFFNS